MDGESDGQLVFRQGDILGDQAVGGKRLIQARHGKGLKDQLVKPRGGSALEGKRVELVIAAQIMEHQMPAFLRLVRGIVELAETLGVFHLAVDADPLGAKGGSGQGNDEGQQGREENFHWQKALNGSGCIKHQP